MNKPSPEALNLDPIPTQDMTQFETWWNQEGSSIRPLPCEDHEEFAKRVSRIAWENGAYVRQNTLVDAQVLHVTDADKSKRQSLMHLIPCCYHGVRCIFFWGIYEVQKAPDATSEM